MDEKGSNEAGGVGLNYISLSKLQRKSCYPKIFLQKKQLASKECVESVADIKISRDIGLFLAQKYLSFTISS